MADARGGSSWFRFLTAVCALVAIALPTRAIMASEERATAAPGRHAWVIVPEGPGRGQSAVLHVPPRGSGEGGAEPGTLRPASWLSRAPTHIAGWGDRMWVVLDRERLGATGMHQRRVLTARAVRVGSAWQMSPSDRLDVLPSLPGDVEIAGFVGSKWGPVTLLERGGGRQGWEVVVLVDGVWTAVKVPWTVAPGAAWLVAHPKGFGLIGAGDRDQRDATVVRARLWIATARKDAEDPDAENSETEWEWQVSEIAWRPVWPALPRARRISAGEIEFLGVGGEVVAAEWSRAAGVTLSVVRAAGVYRLAEIASVPAQRSLAAAGDSVVVVWNPEAPGAGAGAATGVGVPAAVESPSRLRIVEVSVTGQTLYSGPARAGGPVTPRDLQLLAAMLVGVMAAIVLFVLRSDSRSVPGLPPGTVSAGGFRRLLAAAFDFAPALVVASAISGVRPADVLVPAEWFTGGLAFKPLITALLLAWAHSTMGDWLFGASIGKAMVGCEVISLRKAPPAGPDADPGESVVARPTLLQAAIRNFIRWLFPVLGVLMLFDPLRRHPGDLLAGTVVIVEVEDESVES